MNKAVFYYGCAAKQGNYMAQSRLGSIYYIGDGIQCDINQAIHYFKEASCFNDERSKNELGIIYKNGESGKKNIALTIEYFNEAIRQKNDSYARYNLSRIYYFGIDCKRDTIKAINLIEKPPAKCCFPSDCFLFFI